MRVVTRLITEDRGADLIEYALLAGLLALATIAGTSGIGSAMSALWQDLNTAISQAIP